MVARSDSTPSLEQAGNTWTTTLFSPQMTATLGSMLGTQVTGGEVITLMGELGTGKTVFVRGLAAGLGIPPECVTSPTFTLIHEYTGRLRLIHADLYRVESPTEISFIGFHEYLDSSNVVAIEWAERMKPDLPHDRLEIHLEHKTRSARTAVLMGTGPQSCALLSRTLT